MAIDAASPRSRRVLLTAALGAAGAAVASALGRPLPVRAGTDGDVVLGATNNHAQSTVITVPTAGFGAFWGNATGGGNSVGVRGDTSSSFYNASGVWGNATAAGCGVFGSAAGSGAGVRGTSELGHGLYGVGGFAGVVAVGTSVGVDGYSANGEGVVGSTENGTGVRAYSRYGLAVSAKSVENTAIYGISTSGRGVWGESTSHRGVQGRSETGWGVYGFSVSSRGVYGSGPADTGVRGDSATGVGVYGQSKSGPGVAALSEADATGLIAYSGPANSALPAVRAKTGVYAEATQDTASRGVHGRSTAGRGVFGEATSGIGLFGQATTGHALRTSGRVRFDRVSGVATIKATKTSVTVTPGIDLTSASFVLLTPRGNLAGRSLWYTVDATAETITIRVSSAVTTDLRVGWLLLG